MTILGWSPHFHRSKTKPAIWMPPRSVQKGVIDWCENTLGVSAPLIAVPMWESAGNRCFNYGTYSIHGELYDGAERKTAHSNYAPNRVYFRYKDGSSGYGIWGCPQVGDYTIFFNVIFHEIDPGSPGSTVFAFDNYPSTPRNNLLFKTKDGVDRWEAIVGGTGTNRGSDFSVVKHRELTAAFVRSGTSVSPYKNGASVGSPITVGSGSFTPANPRWGCHYHSGSNVEFAECTIDYFYVFETALSSNQIALLNSQPYAMFEPVSKPKYFFTLPEVWNIFTFNNSVFDDRLLNYATVTREAVDVIGGNLIVELENASQTWNSLLTDKTQFFKTGTYKWQYLNDVNSSEVVQLFSGDLTKAAFKETSVKLTFEDKLLRLRTKLVGTNETPVTYTNTDVYPSDLAWWLVTSYGGLSSVENTSNTDIDYDSWSDWHEIFTDNNTRVGAQFEGDNIIDILQDLSALTDSTIYAEGDNKLYFSRWTGTGSARSITNSDMIGTIQLDMTGNDIINKVDVLINYNPTSGTWGGTVTKQNTSSVNSYTEYKEIYDNENIWFVDSVSAINLAERIVYRRGEPNTNIKATVIFNKLGWQLGQEVEFTTQVYSYQDKVLTLQGYTKDIKNKYIEMVLDEGFGRGGGGGGSLRGFILDHATMGLLDQDYNPLL